jgi:hypothetical protein
MKTIKKRRYGKKTSKKTANKRRKTHKNKIRRTRKRRGSGPKKSQEEIDYRMNKINEKLGQGGYEMRPPKSLYRVFFKYSHDDINSGSPAQLNQKYIDWRDLEAHGRKTNRKLKSTGTADKLQRVITSNQKERQQIIQQKRGLIPISPFKQRTAQVEPVDTVVGKNLFYAEKDDSISKSDADADALLKDPYEYTTDPSDYPVEEEEDAVDALFNEKYDDGK